MSPRAAVLSRADQTSLRDVTTFWGLLPWAEATRLPSGHRFAMKTCRPVAGRLNIFTEHRRGLVAQFALGRQGGGFPGQHPILADLEGDLFAVLQGLVGIFLFG